MIIAKNIASIIVGWILGSSVNMGLVQLGLVVMPLENAVDPNDMEAFSEVIGSLDPKFFIFPFLAHALGTMVGATAAYFIAATHKIKFAMAIGALFFLGGIAVNMMLPGPVWFTVVDLVFAYFPMAYLGGLIASRWSDKRKVSQ
ncbi:MAG: hypothetical protein WBG46_13515 [Nonlabens sp.]